jgi:hypothetical protein
VLTPQPPTPPPSVEQTSAPTSQTPAQSVPVTPPNPLERQVPVEGGVPMYHRAVTPEAECEAEIMRLSIAKGEVVLELKKPKETSESASPVVTVVPLPTPANVGASPGADDVASWEPLSGKEILIGRVRDAAEKYFKNKSLMAPPTPSARTNELWEYESSLEFMMGVIHQREGVVDSEGKVLPGSKLDFRSLAVLFPEEFGAVAAQKHLANGDGRGHLARLQNPEFKASIADVERLIRLGLEDRGRRDLANGISVDGAIDLPAAKGSELDSIEKFQRLSLASGGYDRRVGLGTIDAAMRFAERREQAELRDGMLGRDGLIKETAGRTMELRALAANLDQRLAIQSSQTHDARLMSEYNRATQTRQRLISNLEAVVGLEHMEDRGYLKRLVTGLSAVHSIGKNSFSKKELNQAKEKNEERFRTEYTREYEQFISTNDFVRGKSSETIFLQTKAAELLERSRQRMVGAVNFDEERGRAVEMAVQRNTPHFFNGQRVDEISGTPVQQPNLKSEQQLKELAESLTRTRRFGFLPF